MYDEQVAGFRVGPVLAEAMTLSRKHAGVFGAISFLIAVPVTIATHVFSAGLIIGGGPMGLLGPIGSPGGPAIALTVLIVLCAIVVQALAAAAIAYGTVESLRNREVRVLDCIARTLPRGLTTMGIMLLFIILLVLAMVGGAIPGILLQLAGAGTLGAATVMIGGIIAGAFVYTAFWFAIPAAIVEGASVSFSIGRSRHLAKGFRKKLFGLILLTAGLREAAENASPIALDAFRLGEFSWQGIVLHILIVTIFLTWESVAATVAYVKMRTQREGWRPVDIAGVFE